MPFACKDMRFFSINVDLLAFFLAVVFFGSGFCVRLPFFFFDFSFLTVFGPYAKQRNTNY